MATKIWAKWESSLTTVWLKWDTPVLQYSVIKPVMLFHTMDELQTVAHGVIKALTLHEEAIRVRTSLPSATHMRAYMATVTGEPSGIQPPPSDRMEEPHSSPSNPLPGGRTPQHPPSKPWGSCR